MELFERMKLLVFDQFGHRPCRTALRRALSQDVDVLRLRTVAAGHQHENILRLIGYRNHALSGQLQVRPALYPLVESFFRHFTHAMTRALPEKLLNVGLAKTIASDDLRMLGANHHDRFRSRGPSIRRAKLVSIPSPFVPSRSEARTQLSALMAVTVLVS